jgi:flagellin
MQIGTNTIAQTAVRAIHSANAAVATASERISSGLRINRASDDPVGMMLGNKLKTQISSMAKAMDNVNQGVGMTQIVDSSLSQMADVLASMRVVAVSAESSTASTSDRTGYQNALDALVTEINSIAANTVWNSDSLMTASSHTVTIQAGAASADTITLSFVQTTASTLFSGHLSGTSIDISSTTDASNAVGYIDSAIETINAYQSYMGAMDNVMTAQNNVLTGASMAYSTAYGNIMNADMAQETANLASAQVQRDGATAMLAQANGMNKEIVAFLLKSVTN